MARKAKTTRKPKKTWFSKGAGKAKRTRRRPAGPGWLAFLLKAAVMLALLIAIGGIVAGFRYMDDYVKTISPRAGLNGPLELIGPPEWISTELLELIAETAGGREFPLDANSAKKIARNLQALPWLYDAQAQTTQSTIQITAKYRKPAAWITFNKKRYYLAPIEGDDPLFHKTYKSVIVLGYLPIDGLHTIEIKGFAAKKIPSPGSVWQEDDIASAVQLISVLTKMDSISTPGAPLLYEIDSVDVTNFAARRDSSASHTILYAKDGTEIWWGAAYGQSARYLEATEQEKVAILYSEYKRQGTVCYIKKGTGRYIDVRQPQRIFPHPQ